MFLLVSVYCDTAQALVFLLVSVRCDTAQALVFLLVSVCCDSPSLGVLAGVIVLSHSRNQWQKRKGSKHRPRLTSHVQQGEHNHRDLHYSLTIRITLHANKCHVLITKVTASRGVTFQVKIWEGGFEYKKQNKTKL